MAPAEPDQALHIEVVVGLAPRQVCRSQLTLPVGSTVKEALDAAQVWATSQTLSIHTIESGEWTLAVWGRKERLSHVLRNQDRVELVRPLIVDPKEARRVRYKAHVQRGAI